MWETLRSIRLIALMLLIRPMYGTTILFRRLNYWAAAYPQRPIKLDSGQVRNNYGVSEPSRLREAQRLMELASNAYSAETFKHISYLIEKQK